MKTTMRIFLLAALFASAACGNKGGTTSSFDMTVPPCVTSPMSATDVLNACTTAQTGDPAKDYPYFPTLAPGGTLPPLQ
jgi:hypothetical protein